MQIWLQYHFTYNNEQSIEEPTNERFFKEPKVDLLLQPHKEPIYAPLVIVAYIQVSLASIAIRRVDE